MAGVLFVGITLDANFTHHRVFSQKLSSLGFALPTMWAVRHEVNHESYNQRVVGSRKVALWFKRALG